MILDRAVEIGDVCLVMFIVMDGHGLRVYVGFERINRVWKFGKLKSHFNLLVVYSAILPCSASMSIIWMIFIQLSNNFKMNPARHFRPTCVYDKENTEPWRVPCPHKNNPCAARKTTA